MTDSKPTYEELEQRLEALQQEITLHVQAEEDLARTAREWQTTFDAVSDIIWILDKDQRVQRSNKQAELLFQRPCEELIGKHCWEIVHRTKQPIPECPIPRARHSLRRETSVMSS